VCSSGRQVRHWEYDFHGEIKDFRGTLRQIAKGWGLWAVQDNRGIPGHSPSLGCERND